MEKVISEATCLCYDLTPKYHIIHRLDVHKDGDFSRMWDEVHEEIERQKLEKSENCVGSEPFEINVDELWDM